MLKVLSMVAGILTMVGVVLAGGEFGTIPELEVASLEKEPPGFQYLDQLPEKEAAKAHKVLAYMGQIRERASLCLYENARCKKVDDLLKDAERLKLPVKWVQNGPYDFRTFSFELRFIQGQLQIKRGAKSIGLRAMEKVYQDLSNSKEPPLKHLKKDLRHTLLEEYRKQKKDDQAYALEDEMYNETRSEISEFFDH